MAENRVVDVIAKIFTMTSTAKRIHHQNVTPGNAVTMLIYQIRFTYIIWFCFFENAKNLGCLDDAKWRRKGGDGLTVEKFHHLLFIFLVFGSSSASCIGNKEIQVIFHLP